MHKILVTVLLAAMVLFCKAQVKIGYNSGTVNPGAILELSNDIGAAPSTWRSFLPPKVDFTKPVFTSNTVWGIAGTPVAGAMMYNVGEIYSNGFSASTFFLGNNSSVSEGPEYYTSCYSPSPSTLLATDSYSQVISTQNRQW